jgi:GntR family transcriptional repressor for pyruvate dehydrogenase complex
MGHVPYQPRPIGRESIITKAAEEIRRFIEARDLVPGDLLPTEAQLSTTFGISRNSVREALRILDGLGFVEKRPGRRAVVRLRMGLLARQPPARTDILEGVPVAYEARMVIEQRCAELVAQRAASSALAELDSQLSRFEEALKREDFVAAAEAHGDFHTALVRLAGNPVLAAMFEAVRFGIAEAAQPGRETLKGPRTLPVHRAIYRAIAERDAARAGAAVRRHFQTYRALIKFMAAPKPGAGPTDRRRDSPGP